jgi:hypothetical protein
MKQHTLPLRRLRHFREHVLRTVDLALYRYPDATSYLSTLKQRLFEPFLHTKSVMLAGLFQPVFLQQLVTVIPWTTELACIQLALLDLLDHLLECAPKMSTLYAAHMEDLGSAAHTILETARQETLQPLGTLHNNTKKHRLQACIGVLHRLQQRVL